MGWAPLQVQGEEQSHKVGSEQLSVQETFSHLLVFIRSPVFTSGNVTVFAQNEPQQGGDLAATMSI